MKTDYYRYIADFKTDDAKKAAAENARRHTLSMQLSRDNLTLLASNQDGVEPQ
jgi:hypothetical protein